MGGKKYWLVDHSCSPDYVSASGSHCSWAHCCMNAVTSHCCSASESHLCLSLQMNQVQIGLPQAGCGKYRAVYKGCINGLMQHAVLAGADCGPLGHCHQPVSAHAQVHSADLQLLEELLCATFALPDGGHSPSHHPGFSLIHQCSHLHPHTCVGSLPYSNSPPSVVPPACHHQHMNARFWPPFRP